jgi:hypothetical protein
MNEYLATKGKMQYVWSALAWGESLAVSPTKWSNIVLATGEIFKNLPIVSQSSALLTFFFEILGVSVINAYLRGASSINTLV